MTTFEITITVLLTAIVVLMVVLLRTAIEGFHGVWQKQDTILGDTMVLKAYFNTILEKFNDISQQLDNIENSNDQDFEKLTDIVDKMHSNLCVDIADKMVNKMYPVNEGEPLDAAFEPDYKLKKDIECKLNGFAAAVLDAECCPKEILDLWTERICESAHKFIKQFKIDWDKLSKEQQDEFLKRLILPNYDSPFVPPFNPTCEITNNKE